MLSVLLALLVGLQGGPLQSIVQSAQHGAAHHECSHPDGVCPMNPDGPCTCNHDAPSSPDEPALQSCSDSGPIAVRSLALPKWVPTVGTPIPAPGFDAPLRALHRLVLSSQRMGDDVFRPPPVQAAQRPAWTLQASGST